ncbi:protein of unknown function [Methylocaldum szegediense]|uniref:Transposase n=1 Tax=Methylocaldum szegediense TaxID=73780 RepID=A0ABM9I955_9GAMM|nr:protein of unknown function [Methylocaldum szegediense]
MTALLRSFNPLPVIKPGVTVQRQPRCAVERVSIHSRLLSRELRNEHWRSIGRMGVSIHSRLLSRELHARRAGDPHAKRFQSTPGY